MSVDRHPQVGDVFTWPTVKMPRTVVAYDTDWVYWRSAAEHHVWCGGSAAGTAGVFTRRQWGICATLVPPRPKIRDQWGILYGRSPSFYPNGEQWVRERNNDYPIVRVVNGVVCDEHGEPLEVEK